MMLIQRVIPVQSILTILADPPAILIPPKLPDSQDVITLYCDSAMMKTYGNKSGASSDV